jgi:hypothetical protein
MQPFASLNKSFAARKKNTMSNMQISTVDLHGIKPDGATVNLGQIPELPEFKRRELARQYFGPSRNEGDDTDTCIAILTEYHNWLIAQGWTEAPFTLT